MTYTLDKDSNNITLHFTEAVSNVTFAASDTGKQVLFSQILFYTGEQNLVSSVAKLPHISANAGAEIRPFSHLRLIPGFLTDRMHTSSSDAARRILNSASGTNTVLSSALSSLLNTNYNQVSLNILYDATRTVTVRGGYRYVWGDGGTVTLPLAGLIGSEQGRTGRT